MEAKRHGTNDSNSNISLIGSFGMFVRRLEETAE